MAVALSVSIFFLCAGLEAAELKMGYVDVMKVLSDYSKAKESKSAFEAKIKSKDQEAKAMAEEIRKMEGDLSMLSDKAKAEKQKAIDEKKKALNAFYRKTQSELVTEEGALLGGIQKDIENTIKAYSKEAGYDYIFDSRMVLYGKEISDVTGEVIKRLNKK